MPGGVCDFREVDNLDTKIEEFDLGGHMWSNQELISSMTWNFRIWFFSSPTYFTHVQIPKITHIVGSLVTPFTLILFKLLLVYLKIKIKIKFLLINFK